jgi:hypothetical protein
MAMADSIAKQLENYTKINPREVLLVRAEIDGITDEILIFRGFSSSLVRPTAADPDVLVLPEGATIVGIDRLRAPYNPDQPDYIQQNLTWEQVQTSLLS